MNNSFYKVGFFDIDADRLYTEWYNASISFDLFEKTHNLTMSNRAKKYYRMRINHSNHFVKSEDPCIIHGVSKSYDEDTYSIDNIIDVFKNSYTEEIVKQVCDFLNTKMIAYKVTRIKYHALGPGAFLPLHTDGSETPRFFLFIRVKQGSYMHIAGDKIAMHEPGALYRFNCKALHSPINESDDYRLCMIFDVKKILN